MSLFTFVTFALVQVAFPNMFCGEKGTEQAKALV